MLIILLGSNPRFYVLINDGIDICFNDGHLSKTFSIIEVTEEGITIYVNELGFFFWYCIKIH